MQQEGVVALSGELDLSDVDTLALQLESAAAESDNLVVDLTEVTFVDSTVLGTLVEARNKVTASGGSVVLAGPSKNVRRLLEVTSLDQVFPVFDTVAEAMRSDPVA